jgi:hypothetical protein
MEHCLVNIHIVQKKENYWCNYMSAALAHAKFIYEVNKAVLQTSRRGSRATRCFFFFEIPRKRPKPHGGVEAASTNPLAKK